MLNSSANGVGIDVIAGYGGEMRAEPIWQDWEIERGFFGFPYWIEGFWLDSSVGVGCCSLMLRSC